MTTGLPAQQGSEQPEVSQQELDHILMMGRLRNAMFVEMYKPRKWQSEDERKQVFAEKRAEKPKRKRKPSLLIRIKHWVFGG